MCPDVSGQSEVQTSVSAGQRQARCPRCGATLPVEPGWPTWCNQCDWNVVPSGPPPSQRSGRKRSNDQARAIALCTRVSGESPGSVRRGGRTRRLLAVALAILTWVPAAALVAAAAADASLDSGPARVIIPLACLGVAAALRPRAGALDPSAVTVTAASAPQLFEVTEKIASAAGAASPGVIVLDD